MSTLDKLSRRSRDLLINIEAMIVIVIVAVTLFFLIHPVHGKWPIEADTMLDAVEIVAGAAVLYSFNLYLYWRRLAKTIAELRTASEEQTQP